MNKVSVLLFLLLGGWVCKASAQNCGDDFLGTKTLYSNKVYKYTAAPAGYKPVFINHVGRHGARHLTKDVKSAFIYNLLLRADSTGGLTAAGKRLKGMVLALQKVEQGNTKSISAEGGRELKGLGERMYADYKNVFTGKVNLDVAMTKEVRTKQSAGAFLQGLKSNLKDSAAVTFHNDDTNLRFYDASPAYKKFENAVDESELKVSFDKAEKLDDIYNSVGGRLFTADLLKTMNEADLNRITSDLFGFATIVYSLSDEIAQAGFRQGDLNFKSFFTCDELNRLSRTDSAEEYLKKGPGTDNNGIQVRIAIPLLVNFIQTTDAFIKDKPYNAQLRFAHAETIAPFAALLRLSTADRPTKNLEKLSEIWQSSKVIPLSANIQWIFYKKDNTGDYLVKILLNEQEVKITSLKTRWYPYYKWTDLRTFYMALLNRSGVKLTDNMDGYLENLK